MTKPTSEPSKGIAAAEPAAASPIKTDATPRKLDIDIPDSCASCKAYASFTATQGKCRYEPPKAFCLFMPPAMAGAAPQPYMVSDWPIVNADQWCRKFEARREGMN